MGEPIIITTPSGDRMAVIPLEDYESLVEAAENAADIRAYDEAKRRLASGEDELIPESFLQRLLDRENPVRVWRELRGLSAPELAQRAGIGGPELYAIEGGGAPAAPETMRRLADALGVQPEDIAPGLSVT